MCLGGTFGCRRKERGMERVVAEMLASCSSVERSRNGFKNCCVVVRESLRVLRGNEGLFGLL